MVNNEEDDMVGCREAGDCIYSPVDGNQPARCLPMNRPLPEAIDRSLPNNEILTCNEEAGYTSIHPNNIRSVCEKVDNVTTFDVNGCAINYCYMPPLNQTYKYKMNEDIHNLNALMDKQQILDSDIEDIGARIENIDDLDNVVKRRLLTKNQIGNISCSNWTVPEKDEMGNIITPSVICRNEFSHGKQVIQNFEFVGCTLPGDIETHSYRNGTTSYEYNYADCLGEWGDGITYISGTNLDDIEDYGSGPEVGVSVTHITTDGGVAGEESWTLDASARNIHQRMYEFMSKSKDMCDKKQGCIGFTIRELSAIETGGIPGVMMSKQQNDMSCLSVEEDLEIGGAHICDSWREAPTPDNPAGPIRTLGDDGLGSVTNYITGDIVEESRGSSCLYTTHSIFEGVEGTIGGCTY